MSVWSEGDLPLIPDFTEPLRLYRTWNYRKQEVSADGSGLRYSNGLFSTSREYTWTPGEQTAACEEIRGYTKVEPHESPDAACHCGFYGYHLPVQANEFASIGPFVGVIEGYGKVVPHLLGARVGKARIIAIAISDRYYGDNFTGIGDFLREYFKDTCVSTDFKSSAEMYEKYPPQDVSTIIGMTAGEAVSKYQRRQADDYGFSFAPNYMRQMYGQMYQPPPSLYASATPLKCNCVLCTGQYNLNPNVIVNYTSTPTPNPFILRGGSNLKP